jgi:hypothetical protein
VVVDGFAASGWLSLLVVIAAVAVGYVLVRRRRLHVMRFTNFGAVGSRRAPSSRVKPPRSGRV